MKKNNLLQRLLGIYLFTVVEDRQPYRDPKGIQIFANASPTNF